MKTDPSHLSPELFRFLERLHGHRCPMSILGARLGAAARRRLGETGDEHLLARCFHRTCALDGIQVTTGCTPGKRNLVVEPGEEHRLILSAEESGRAVEAVLTSDALGRSRRYGELRRRAAALPDGPERRSLEEQMAGVLRALEAASEGELVDTRTLAP